MSRKFTKLNAAAMKVLPPNKRIVEHGIIYEKNDRGEGRFEICISIQNKRLHRCVGREADGITRRHAEALIERLKTDARQGKLNPEEKKAQPLLFEVAFEQYLTHVEQSGITTAYKKRQQYRDYLLPCFKGLGLNKLSAFEIERLKHFGKEKGLSVASINRLLALMSHFMTCAIEWGWIQNKPKIRKSRENNARIVFLSEEESRTLLENAKGFDHPYIYPFVLMGLDCGMRKNEILSIRLENIDLSRRIIFIPQAKAGAREQPITQRVADHLAKMIENQGENGWLFPAMGKISTGEGHFRGIEKPFRKLVISCGLDPAVIVRHTLRHTAVSHLVQAGVDLPTVQKISGHKSYSMVLRYAHLSQDHVMNAMDKLQNRLG
ncbi:MAG: site-specific integrase [Vampirovibrionales bacterium]|nr:site-specific integrase [Vampirovibrionales bacterium]